jgi:hypothetical protein
MQAEFLDLSFYDSAQKLERGANVMFQATKSQLVLSGKFSYSRRLLSTSNEVCASRTNVPPDQWILQPSSKEGLTCLKYATLSEPESGSSVL